MSFYTNKSTDYFFKKDVFNTFQISKSRLTTLIKQGLFPSSIRKAGKAAWPAYEIRPLFELYSKKEKYDSFTNTPLGKEIKKLVKKIYKERTNSPEWTNERISNLCRGLTPRGHAIRIDENLQIVCYGSGSKSWRVLIHRDGRRVYDKRIGLFPDISLERAKEIVQELKTDKTTSYRSCKTCKYRHTPESLGEWYSCGKDTSFDFDTHDGYIGNCSYWEE